jgi:hypothetical protein
MERIPIGSHCACAEMRAFLLVDPQVMDGHTNSVISLLLVNRLMYTGSADGTAKCWVTEFGDCSRVYKGHKGSVISMKFKNGVRKLSTCTVYVDRRELFLF